MQQAASNRQQPAENLSESTSTCSAADAGASQQQWLQQIKRCVHKWPCLLTLCDCTLPLHHGPSPELASSNSCLNYIPLGLALLQCCLTFLTSLSSDRAQLALTCQALLSRSLITIVPFEQASMAALAASHVGNLTKPKHLDWLPSRMILTKQFAVMPAAAKALCTSSSFAQRGKYARSKVFCATLHACAALGSRCC